MIIGAETGARRIVDGVERGPPITIHVDARPIQAHEGETLAASLLAAGITRFRASAERGDPRGPFCLMGICQECVVVIDGRAVTACQTPVRAGMHVRLIDGAAP